jgi:hypothetical protein
MFIASSFACFSVRNVKLYDTPNGDLTAVDRALRTRWEYPTNVKPQITFKVNNPFKEYSCSRNMLPTSKYEDATECKCEQEVAYVHTFILFVYSLLYLFIFVYCSFIYLIW